MPIPQKTQARISLYKRLVTLLLLATAVYSALTTNGVTDVLEPTKDVTIFSENGNLSSALGDLFVGKTAGSSGTDRRRALLSFDLEGSDIPSSAEIMSVTLTMRVTKTSQSSSTNNISLHKLNQDWGEGTSNSINGKGTSAAANDATWSHRFFGTSDTWNQGGGDFNTTPSGSQSISGIGTKTWNSTTQIVTDVQDWLDNPSTNFGWILIGSEASSGSAQRFNSSEDSVDFRPKLTVEYTNPLAMDQTINFTTPTGIVFGEDPFALVASASSGLPVSFEVVSGSQFIDLNGSTVTIQGAGSVTIRASQEGNGEFNPAPEVSKTFAISKASQTITFNALSDKVFDDAPFTLNASSDSGLAVSYSVLTGSNLVSLNGTAVTIQDVGSVTIQASQTGNTNYNAASSVSQSFTIAKADQSIDFDTIGNKSVGDAAFPLSATADSGLPITFSIVSGAEFADLDSGTVTILGAGDVTIRASQDGNSQYNAAPTVPQTFTIAKGNQSISFISPNNLTFGDAPFNLSAFASSGLPVSVSLVDGFGLIDLTGGNTVTILGAGSVTIRANQGGNDDYNAAPPADLSFTINKADQTIVFNLPGQLAIADSPIQLTATVTSGLEITFTVVEGAEIAAISGSLVTLTAEGQVTIEATQLGDDNFNPAVAVSETFLAVTDLSECQDVFCGEDIPGFPGWRASPWYLNYNVEFLPWIFHDEHSWQFLFEGNTEEVIFMWDLGLGEWIFFNENAYRWVFIFGGENAGWVFTFGDNTPERRFFQRLDDGSLFSVPADLPVK